MHATEREKKILELLERQGFVAFKELERSISASPATLRRDLERMSNEGRLKRVRGGAKLPPGAGERSDIPMQLYGIPFDENITRHTKEKIAIGRAAATFCEAGTAVMIDGGSTTLQMCQYLKGLNLQVLTNSLHIVNALLPQEDIQILVPGGAIFREQNIILAPGGDDLIPRFHAPKLFLGAAAIGRHGLMQTDVVLVASERRFIQRADEVIVLADSSKFMNSSGNVTCSLEEIDVVITDKGIRQDDVDMLDAAGIRLIIAE